MWLAAKIVVALVVALVIYLIAARVVRNFVVGAAPVPGPGELRPVDYRYRCQVCGVEVVMTAAPGDEEPEPPRHCREEMLLVTETGGGHAEGG